MKFSYVKEYGVLYLFFCAYWIYTRFAYFKSPFLLQSETIIVDMNSCFAGFNIYTVTASIFLLYYLVLLIRRIPAISEIELIRETSRARYFFDVSKKIGMHSLIFVCLIVLVNLSFNGILLGAKGLQPLVCRTFCVYGVMLLLYIMILASLYWFLNLCFDSHTKSLLITVLVSLLFVLLQVKIPFRYWTPLTSFLVIGPLIKGKAIGTHIVVDIIKDLAILGVISFVNYRTFCRKDVLSSLES